MLKNLTYDQICHEHLTYYTLTVFKKIMKNNLKILDISFNEINGGSAEIICAKRKVIICQKNKIKLFWDEKKINHLSYKNFNSE